MQFSGLTLSGAVGFSYEIFPNITCPALNNCGTNSANLPTFDFEAGTNTGGVDPMVSGFGNNGVMTAVAPASNGSDGSSTKSPDSNSETAPQLIGTWSGTLGANASDTELDFVDWPATIGIDNLTVSWNSPSPVPDPSSVLLLGTIVSGIVLRKKLRKTV
jgi:hypothetical protein